MGSTHAQIASRQLPRATVGYEVEADLGTFRARSRLEAGADDYGIAHPWVLRARVEGKQRRHEWQVKGAQTRLVLPRTTVCQVAAKQDETPQVRRDLHAPSVMRTRGKDPGMSHRDPEPKIGLCEPDL